MRPEDRYSRAEVEALIRGGWAASRSHAETYGDIEAPGLAKVMDFERAIAALAQSRHPEGAAILALWSWGFEPGEVDRALRARPNFSELSDRNWMKVANKAKAWVRAYLNGGNPEIAWDEA